jgi:hypothetical protein
VVQLNDNIYTGLIKPGERIGHFSAHVLTPASDQILIPLVHQREYDRLVKRVQELDAKLEHIYKLAKDGMIK